MAKISGVITLGIGPDTTTPITHFVLVGLNVPELVATHGNIASGFAMSRQEFFAIDPSYQAIRFDPPHIQMITPIEEVD